MNSQIKAERYASGKWDILTVPPYPVRIGHIIGSNKCYLAEQGSTNLGYFKTLKEAKKAIWDHAKRFNNEL